MRYGLWLVVALSSFVATWARAQVLGPPTEAAAAPIPSTSAGRQTASGLAFDGTAYILLYVDESSQIMGNSRLARLAVDGTVTELGYHAYPPTLEIACRPDGECAGLTVSDPEGDRRDVTIGVYRFRSDGTLLDATPVPLGVIARPSPIDFRPRIVATVGGFVVAADEYAGPLRAWTFSDLGGGDAVEIAPYAGHWAVSCASGHCLFASRGTSLTVRRYTDALVATDADPISLPDPFASSTPGAVDAAFDGASFRVVQRGFPSPVGYVVPVSGTPSGTYTILDDEMTPYGFDCHNTGECITRTAAGSGSWYAAGGMSGGFRDASPFPVLFRCGVDRCVSVYTEASTIYWQVDSAPRRSGIGSGVADYQAGPVAVAGRMISFYREVAGRWNLVMRPLDTTDLPWGAEHTVIPSLPAPSPTDLEAVGEEYAFTVNELSLGVGLRRLDSLGNLIGERTSLSPCLNRAALAWNGTAHLSACIDPSGRALLRRLDALGQRLDDTAIVLVPSGATDVDVAPDGDGWLVAVSAGTRIRAYHVSADATIADPAGILVRDHAVGEVRLATVGSSHAIAWEDGSASRELRLAILGPDDEIAPLGGEVVVVRSFERLPFAIAGHGDVGYLVWEDDLESGLVRTVGLSRVGEDGTLGRAVEVTTDPRWTLDYPNVAVGGSRPVVIYSTALAEPEFAPSRVRLRTIDEGPSTCLVPTDCPSGSCVAGVCCDRACDGGCEECTTGTCTLSLAGTPCGDACGEALVCDGIGPTCPAPMACESDAGTDTPDAPTAETDAGAPPVGSTGGCRAMRSAPGSAVLPWLLVGLLFILRRR